jgi:RNA recognition motif-containing protein
MGKKIFVGGLKWGMDSNSLRTEFERFGQIEEATVVRDRDTGRSKGFGFVTFTDDNCAQQAVNEMNGKEIDGRVVKVDFAQDKPPRTGGTRRFNDRRNDLQ